jgi:hypothetical protein
LSAAGAADSAAEVLRDGDQVADLIGIDARRSIELFVWRAA